MMPPLTMQIAVLRNSGLFVEAFLAQMALASMVIVSAWAALTFGWFMTGLMKEARNAEDLILALLVWSPVLLLMLWMFVGLLGWSMVSPFRGVVFWMWPFTEYSLTKGGLPQRASASVFAGAALGK